MSTLRALRILRVLRSLRFFKGIKTILAVVYMALPRAHTLCSPTLIEFLRLRCSAVAYNVVVFLGFLFVVCGIIGVQMVRCGSSSDRRCCNLTCTRLYPLVPRSNHSPVRARRI